MSDDQDTGIDEILDGGEIEDEDNEASNGDKTSDGVINKFDDESPREKGIIVKPVIRYLTFTKPKIQTFKISSLCITKAVNAFACCVMSALTLDEDFDGNENIFFSPWSVFTVLAMLYAGSSGRTARQLDRTLGLSDIRKTLGGAGIHLHMAKVKNILKTSSRGQRGIKLVDRIWVDLDTTLQDDFTKTLKTFYGSTVETINMAKALQLTLLNGNSFHNGCFTGKDRPTILNSKSLGLYNENSYSHKLANIIPKLQCMELKINNRFDDSEQTTNNSHDFQSKLENKSRPKLIEPDLIIAASFVQLTGKWRNRFNSKETRVLPFYVNKEITIATPMMYLKTLKDTDTNILYQQHSDCQVLCLPYMWSRLSMVIVLPRENHGMDLLEEKLLLCPSLVYKWMNTKPLKIDAHILLPKFKIDNSFSFARILATLGIEDLFTDNLDMSGVTGTNNARMPSVLQKAVVDVSEEGSEAGSGIYLGNARRRTKKSVFFCADHPFLFFVFDSKTQIILFMGKLTNPESSCKLQESRIH